MRILLSQILYCKFRDILTWVRKHSISKFLTLKDMFCETFTLQESFRYLLIVVCVCAQVFGQISDNDTCVHPSGDPARCRLTPECPEATVLVERGVKPVMCEGRHEGGALICCRENTTTPQPVFLVGSESHDGNNQSSGTSSKTGSGSGDKGCTDSGCLRTFGVSPSGSPRLPYDAPPPVFPPNIFLNTPQNFDPNVRIPGNNFWRSAGRPERSDWDRYDYNFKSFWQNNQDNGGIGPSRAAPVPWFKPIARQPVNQPQLIVFPREADGKQTDPHYIKFPESSDNADRRHLSDDSDSGQDYGGTTKMRISQQMCANYSFLTSTVSLNPQGLLLRPLKDDFRVNVCSERSVPLIINGVNALPGEFPHMAVLGYLNANQTDWDCGGSLISDDFVLTAAHCVLTTKGRPAVVRLGEHNLYSVEDGVKPRDYGIAEFITFDSYDSSKLYNDIALLRLNERVLFDSSIRPACLPSENFTFSSAVATGWGLTDIGGDRSDILQKVLLSPVPTVRCNRAYSVEALTSKLFKGIDNATQMCYGEYEGRDTAQGDSGGPLQVSDENCNYFVVGVTSFGKPFGKKRSAGVYTRVQNYLDWIERVVWPKS